MIDFTTWSLSDIFWYLFEAFVYCSFAYSLGLTLSRWSRK